MTKESEGSTVFKSIFTGLLLSAFGASIGYGISQTTVTQEFKSHSASDVVKLQYLTETDVEIKATISEMRNTSEKHMLAVIELFKASYNQNQEFINLLKVQNDMIRQQHSIKP